MTKQPSDFIRDADALAINQIDLRPADRAVLDQASTLFDLLDVHVPDGFELTGFALTTEGPLPRFVATASSPQDRIQWEPRFANGWFRCNDSPC